MNWEEVRQGLNVRCFVATQFFWPFTRTKEGGTDLGITPKKQLFRGTSLSGFNQHSFRLAQNALFQKKVFHVAIENPLWLQIRRCFPSRENIQQPKGFQYCSYRWKRWEMLDKQCLQKWEIREKRWILQQYWGMHAWNEGVGKCM